MSNRPPNRLTFTKSRLETADTNPSEAVKYQLRMGAPDEFTPFTTFQSTITLSEIYTGTPNAYGLHINNYEFSTDTAQYSYIVQDTNGISEIPFLQVSSISTAPTVIFLADVVSTSLLTISSLFLNGTYIDLFNNTVSISSLTTSTIVVGPNQSPVAYPNEVTAAGFNMWSPTVFASTSLKCFVGAAGQTYFDMTQYVGGANANTNLYFRSISSGTYSYPLTLSTSRVGINTINPLYNLDVTGTTRILNDRGVLTLQGAQDSNSLYTTFQKATLTGYVGWFGFGLQGPAYSNYFGMQAPANANIAFYPGGAAAASPPLFLGSNSRVGILTDNPAYTLDVNGSANLTGNLSLGGVTIPTLANGYEAIGLVGGNSVGYIYGAFESLADGIHLSYNYINCNLGNTTGYIPVPAGRTSQLDIGYGTIGFAIGASNTPPTTRMTLNDSGLTLNGTLTIPSTTTANSSRIDFPATNYSIVCGVSTLGGTNQVANKCQIMTYTGAAVISAFTVGTDRTKLIGINNCNDPQYTLDVNGSTHQSNNLTTWGVTSDRRIKTNIEFANLDICYSSIQALTLRRYEYDSNLFPDREDKHVIGLIAQEVQPIFPKAVTQTSSLGFSDLLGIDYDQLYMGNIGATKKLMELMEQTVQRVTQLESLQQQSASTIAGLQQQLGSA